MDGQRNKIVVYVNMCKFIPGDDGGKITADEIGGKTDTVDNISDDTNGEIDTVDEIGGNVVGTDGKIDDVDNIATLLMKNFFTVDACMHQPLVMIN